MYSFLCKPSILATVYTVRVLSYFLVWSRRLKELQTAYNSNIKSRIDVQVSVT